MEILYTLTFFLLPLPFIILSVIAPYLSIGANILSALGIYGWLGKEAAIGFILVISLFSCVTGCLMRYSLRTPKIIATGIIITALASWIFLSTCEAGYPSEWKRNFERLSVESLSYYKERGIEQEKIILLEGALKQFTRIAVMGFPAILIIAITVFVSANYFIARRILIRLGHKYGAVLPFSYWKIPDIAIWAFIGAFFLILAGKNRGLELLHRTGLNFMILMLAAYFLQGIFVVNFFLDKWKSPLFLKGILYIIILLQPVLSILIFLWGIFDVWFNFRRLGAVEIKS